MSNDSHAQNGSPGTTTLPPNPNRQRFKPQLSCTFCRSRKLKCDRDLPCESCVKRNVASSCTYVHGDVKGKGSSHVQKPNRESKDIKGRIRHLEELVISAINGSNTNGSSTNHKNTPPENGRSVPDLFAKGYPNQWSDPAVLRKTAESFSRVSLGDNGLIYNGDSPWTEISDQIAGLKDSLEGEDDADSSAKSESTACRGPDLLLGERRKVTKHDVLAAMPSKHVVDRLVSQYFDSDYVQSVMIHGPTFKKEYAQFWDDPIGAPIMWIGLLFAVSCLSLQIESMSGDGSVQSLAGEALRDPEERMNTLRNMTVHCLILGKYTEPSTYTVETLLFYFLTEYHRPQGNLYGNWVVLGTLVRSALRMGLHRDASHNLKISVFRGEMRRRIWLAITHLDLHTSSQLGMPRMIKEGMADTQHPRNILDEDFDESISILPPSRPENAGSPLGYLTVKTSITSIFGIILDGAGSFIPMAYDEVMRLDGLLKDAHSKIPDVIRAQTVEDLKTGSPDIRIKKFSIENCYQMAVCVLHSKYLIPEQPLQRYSYSTKSCVDSAIQLLQFQIYANSEMTHGETPYRQKWSTTSLVTREYILAIMILYIYLRHHFPTTGGSRPAIPIRWSRGEILNILEESYKVWESSAKSSTEAAQTARTFRALLEEIRDIGSKASTNVVQPSTHSTNVNSLDDSLFDTTEQPSLPNGTSQSGNFSLSPQVNTFDDNFTGFDGGMAGMPMNLDWDLWDNHFQTDSSIDTPQHLHANIWDFDYRFSASDILRNSSTGWDQ